MYVTGDWTQDPTHTLSTYDIHLQGLTNGLKLKKKTYSFACLCEHMYAMAHICKSEDSYLPYVCPKGSNSGHLA